MSLILHTDLGNFRSFKILIAAEYNSINVQITENFVLGQSNKTAEYLKISPLGRVPALQTAHGNLSESNSIAKYISGLKADSGLLGGSYFESAEVDQWIQFNSHNIELPATVWVYPVLGHTAANEAHAARAKADLATALNVLEAHLLTRTYLVGHSITLADITIATTLLYPFKFVADAAYRSAFPNVLRWFETLVNQQQFVDVIGKVALCTTEGAAGSAKDAVAAGKAGKSEKKAWDGVKKEKAPKPPKAEKAPEPPKPPKEEKKKAAKEEDDEDDTPKEAKKEDHAFKLLDQSSPSPFVMDAWKRCYSNCHGDYESAMKTFWETFDSNGWSLWRGDYNYNDELKILFMTSNLVGGFIQRTDEIRKWLFGTMTIRGDEEAKQFKITAYFLIRGHEIQPLIDCNDDASCYTWTKMDIPASEEQKKLLFDYWTTDESLEGEKVLDSRCYK